MALSKNRIKYIHSLEQKKNRKADKVSVSYTHLTLPTKLEV